MWPSIREATGPWKPGLVPLRARGARTGLELPQGALSSFPLVLSERFAQIIY